MIIKWFNYHFVDKPVTAEGYLVTRQLFKVFLLNHNYL